MMNKLKTAFTLVELLVVMGVLAVLAAGLIALINPADRIAQANDTKVISDLNQIVGGVNSFVAGVGSGSYPVIAAGTSANFSTVYAAISNELTASPTAVAGYVYAYNCVALGPCKIAVELKSKKNLGVGTVAGACWISTAGSVTVYTGATLAAVGVDNVAACP